MQLVVQNRLLLLIQGSILLKKVNYLNFNEKFAIYMENYL